jgi:hypothetical protein
MDACLEGFPVVSLMSRIVAHSCRPLQRNPYVQRDVGVDTARLRAIAGTGFAGVTEFMEQLVTRTGVEFRRLKRAMEQAVALSLQQGASDAVTHTALHQAFQAEGLEIDVDGATVQRLQDPATILAAKQVVGGPGRQSLEIELTQLDAFVTTQCQAWQRRHETLQKKYDQCRTLG